MTHRRADGALVHLKCNAVPLRDDEGADIGAIALVQDVTAETQAALRAEALAQATGRRRSTTSSVRRWPRCSATSS